MAKVKRIAVGLDLTEMDEVLIKYASFIAERRKAKDLYFINIIENVAFPAEVLKEYPDIVEKTIEEKERKMRDVVDKTINGNLLVNRIFLVKKGKIAKTLLKIIDADDIDLMILGRSQHGLLAQRLARLAGCNLQIIPNKVEPKMNVMHVPNDFTDTSLFAIHEAIEIGSRIGDNTEIHVQNIYSVPAGYHYTGKSFEEFAEVMKKQAEHKFKQLLAKLDTRGIPLIPFYTLDANDRAVRHIYDFAKRLRPDTIVIGAKGRTATTALFLSSFGEKLISVNKKFPMRIVRPKKKHAGIIDFLREEI
jgi:nucleotide-binding universal stress UspA family protein